MTVRAIAAALTPLRDEGSRVDLEAIPPYVAFLAAGGVNGVLALGSTGEGVLLSVSERKEVLSAFAACELPVIAHCGAQTTADTVALVEHAATTGVEGVAVIGPPYFPLDDESLFRHFAAAARACDPLPFYIYEFEKVSGYAVPLSVVERLRGTAGNLTGLKVSDSPFSKVRPYLIDGLDVFVGAEALIEEALGAGAVGAVSGLASAFPEVVSEAVRTADSTRVGKLRALLDAHQRLAALKAVVASKGVPFGEDMRAPLRSLTDEERLNLFSDLEGFFEAG
jgi:dihydrodipicolinate synthase/N-acetylneuraminate lyase